MRRRSSASRLLSLEEKKQLEAVLGESIEPALGLPAEQRLHYVGALLLSRASRCEPPSVPLRAADAPAPPAAEVNEVIRFLKRAFEVALQEAARVRQSKEPPITRMALSLLRQAAVAARASAEAAAASGGAGAPALSSSSSRSSSHRPAATGHGGVVIPKLDVDRAAAAIQARHRGTVARQQTRLLYTRKTEASAGAPPDAPRAAASAGPAAAPAALPPLADRAAGGAEGTDSPGLLRPVSAKSSGASNSLESSPAIARRMQPSPAPSTASNSELETAANAAAKEMAEQEAVARAAAAADKAQDEQAAWEAQKAAAQAQAAAMVARIEAEEKAKAEAAAAAAPSAEEIAAAEQAAAEKAAAEQAAAEKAAAEKAASDKAARAAARAEAAARMAHDSEHDPSKRQLLAARKAKLNWQRARLHLVDDSSAIAASSGAMHDVRAASSRHAAFANSRRVARGCGALSAGSCLRALLCASPLAAVRQLASAVCQPARCCAILLCAAC